MNPSDGWLLARRLRGCGVATLLLLSDAIAATTASSQAPTPLAGPRTTLTTGDTALKAICVQIVSPQIYAGLPNHVVGLEAGPGRAGEFPADQVRVRSLLDNHNWPWRTEQNMVWLLAHEDQPAEDTYLLLFHTRQRRFAETTDDGRVRLGAGDRWIIQRVGTFQGPNFTVGGKWQEAGQPLYTITSTKNEWPNRRLRWPPDAPISPVLKPVSPWSDNGRDSWLIVPVPDRNSYQCMNPSRTRGDFVGLQPIPAYKADPITGAVSDGQRIALRYARRWSFDYEAYAQDPQNCMGGYYCGTFDDITPSYVGLTSNDLGVAAWAHGPYLDGAAEVLGAENVFTVQTVPLDSRLFDLPGAQAVVLRANNGMYVGTSPPGVPMLSAQSTLDDAMVLLLANGGGRAALYAALPYRTLPAFNQNPRNDRAQPISVHDSPAENLLMLDPGSSNAIFFDLMQVTGPSP